MDLKHHHHLQNQHKLYLLHHLLEILKIMAQCNLLNVLNFQVLSLILSKLFDSRFTVINLSKFLFSFAKTVNSFNHMNWNTYRSCLIGNCSTNSLFNPQVAYVEKRKPRLGSNLTTAFINPILPS